MTENHNGHQLSKLKDTITQLKTKIEQDILANLSKTRRTVSMLEQNLSLFNCQVETSIRSMTEEGNKITSMVDQYIAKRIASVQGKARHESKRLSAILDDHKIAFNKANNLDIRK